jgi:hypothetical protein
MITERKLLLGMFSSHPYCNNMFVAKTGEAVAVVSSSYNDIKNGEFFVISRDKSGNWEVPAPKHYSKFDKAAINAVLGYFSANEELRGEDYREILSVKNFSCQNFMRKFLNIDNISSELEEQRERNAGIAKDIESAVENHGGRYYYPVMRIIDQRGWCGSFGAHTQYVYLDRIAALHKVYSPELVGELQSALTCPLKVYLNRNPRELADGFYEGSFHRNWNPELFGPLPQPIPWDEDEDEEDE